MKHDRSLCHECKDVGMCDGQPADDCDVMNLAEFENTLKDPLAKLDDQFAEMANVLTTKKEAFIELYRKDPRISHDEAVSCLLTTNREEVMERNAMHEQLVQLQEQLEKMQEHMAEQQEQLKQQQEIAAVAEEMNRQLADQKTELEDMCAELENRLTEEKGKSQTRLEAIARQLLAIASNLKRLQSIRS